MYSIVFLGREQVFRRQAIESLTLSSGERVLEVGCGNGNSFASLRTGVGSNGTIVGFDVNKGMVRTARNRIRGTDWQNVHVIRGDAQRAPVVDGTFDAAYASMSLSAVPDPARAIDCIEAALRPGGRLVVLDAQPFQRWPLRLANPIIVPLAERATNWVPQVDLLEALRRTFETVGVATFHAGSILVAQAWKRESE